MERSGRSWRLAAACAAVTALTWAAPAGPLEAPAVRGPAARAAADVDAAQPDGPHVEPVRAVPDFPPRYRVGAVFSLSGAPHHYCSGSVVASPRKDLVITAAHCVHGGAGGGYRTGLAFAPGLLADRQRVKERGTAAPVAG